MIAGARALLWLQVAQASKALFVAIKSSLEHKGRGKGVNGEMVRTFLTG